MREEVIAGGLEEDGRGCIVMRSWLRGSIRVGRGRA